MARLSRADLEAALAFAADLGAAAPERARQDTWILERLATLIGLDFAGYYQLDASSEPIHETEYGIPLQAPTGTELTLPAIQLPFCVYAKRAGNPYFPARRESDILDVLGVPRAEQPGLADAGQAVQMRMPGTPGTHWTLDLGRTGRDFSDRDLRLLDALRPALVGYEAYREVAGQLDGQHASRDPDRGQHLSRRENEVLDLVARGASNSEIGLQLSISPSTVKKHLENIFGKLDVGSRTAALAHTGRTFAVQPDVRRLS